MSFSAWEWQTKPCVARYDNKEICNTDHLFLERLPIHAPSRFFISTLEVLHVEPEKTDAK